MEKKAFLKIGDKFTIAVFIFVFLNIILSCSSTKKTMEKNDYKKTVFYIEDYLSLPYTQGYIEAYDEFKINIEHIKSKYYLIIIYPFIDKVVLNSNEYINNNFFPQAYISKSGKTFFIDFQYKSPPKEVYDKLTEINKIDSTYIWLDQGKISEDEGIIINKLDDSIMSQKYLVKINKGKFELIYDWFGN